MQEKSGENGYRVRDIKALANGAKRAMDIIDTHQHLWDLSRHTYAWCAGIPKLNRSFVSADYQQAIANLPNGANVSAAVFVEADVDEKFIADETKWVLSLAENPENATRAVVAAARPESDGFLRSIEPYLSHPAFKGIRRVLHTQPDDLSQSSTFVENIRALSKFKLTFDLCVLERQLPIALQLVRACPDTQFILDHCGVPEVQSQKLDPWRAQIKALASCSNVVGCKISGLIAYTNSDDAFSAIKPYVDHAIEAFGWDRVMFGSDWPVCLLTSDLSKWVGILQRLASHASVEQQAMLFSKNARRVYRF